MPYFIVILTFLFVVSSTDRARANHCLPGFQPFAAKAMEAMAQAKSARAQGNQSVACARFNSAIGALQAGLAYVRQPSCGHPEYQGRPQNLASAAALMQTTRSYASLYCGNKPNRVADGKKIEPKAANAEAAKQRDKQQMAVQTKDNPSGGKDDATCPGYKYFGECIPVEQSSKSVPLATETTTAVSPQPKATPVSPTPTSKPSGVDTTARVGAALEAVAVAIPELPKGRLPNGSPDNLPANVSTPPPPLAPSTTIQQPRIPAEPSEPLTETATRADPTISTDDATDELNENEAKQCRDLAVQAVKEQSKRKVKDPTKVVSWFKYFRDTAKMTNKKLSKCAAITFEVIKQAEKSNAPSDPDDLATDPLVRRR
jgi:hypothetical protein